jgi:hypothetical protein
MFWPKLFISRIWWDYAKNKVQEQMTVEMEKMSAQLLAQIRCIRSECNYWVYLFFHSWTIFSSLSTFSTFDVMYQVYFTLLIDCISNIIWMLYYWYLLLFIFIFLMFVYEILSILLLCTIYIIFLFKSSSCEN